MGISVSLTPYTLGGNSNAPTTGTTLAFTLTHAVAAGDALVVSAGSDSAGDMPVISVTDTQGNTWTQAKSDVNQTDAQTVFTCLNAKAMTTSDVITATFSGTAGSKTLLGRGCAGIWTNAAVDVAIVADNPASAAPSSGASSALKQSSEWAVAFLINANGGGTPSAWTGGFTAALTEHATSNQFHTVADQVTSATTALTAAATIVSSKWCMVLVTLRAGPYTAGSNTFAAGSTSSVLTASANVVSGDASIVVLGSATSGTTPTALTDSASQTYTLVASETLSNMQSWTYVKYNSAALTSGTSTFTATWSNTSGVKYMAAVGCNGLATSSAFDQSAGNDGTSTSPSSGATSSLAQANEVAIGVIVGGSGSGSVGFSSSWRQIGSTLHSGAYMAVGTLSTSSTSGVTVTGSLGSSAAWGALVATFSPVAGGGGGGGGGFQINTASPLSPDAVVGQAYSNTLTTLNGSPPVTFAVTAGAVPTGMTLSPGTSSGGSSAIANVGAMAGPNGSAGMNFSDWQTANTTIGPLTGTKLFYGGDLPSSWTAVASSSTAAPAGTTPKQISDAGGIPIICWNGPSPNSSPPPPSSASIINTFLSSIPAGRAVGFSWQQEAEGASSGAGAFATGSQYTSAFTTIARVIHSFGNPLLFTVHCASWGPYGPTGRAFNGSFLPPAVDTDVYGMDL
jgi:hypothetical protein